MKTYTNIVQISLYKIQYLLVETNEILTEELTDELKEFLTITKIKLEKMKGHCEQYLKEKK